MRIIGGKLRGRKLRAAPAKGVRPTADRVRESLFSRLGAFDGSRVLDIFAGTGSLGIEALSRGAASCCFVEQAPPALAVLRANLRDLGLRDCTEIARGEASVAIRRIGRNGREFDLIFLDPPYASALAEAALRELMAAKLLSCGGTIVVESSKHYPVAAVAGLSLIDERGYGDTVISRWELSSPAC